MQREDRMDTKRTIATDIALQTRVLRECSKHRRLYLVDADPAPAIELALELLQQRSARVALFRFDWHKLTELICDILGKAPVICPECRAALLLSWETRAVAETDLAQLV
jgi:hypothetical protein